MENINNEVIENINISGESKHEILLDSLIKNQIIVEGDDVSGYTFSYKGIEMGMNFKSIEGIADAMYLISRAELAYETAFDDKDKRPEFYVYGNTIKIDNRLLGDTTYFSLEAIEKFLAPYQGLFSGDGSSFTFAAQDLADKLNQICKTDAIN